jgi:hypothetical protein
MNKITNYETTVKGTENWKYLTRLLRHEKIKPHYQYKHVNYCIS